MNKPLLYLRSKVSEFAHVVWIKLPLSTQRKQLFKHKLFSNFSYLLRRNQAYRSWQSMNGVNGLADAPSRDQVQFAIKSPVTEYIPLLHASPPENVPVRLIAFYLPQFHAIAENNEWWGEGFTEWTNVKPAQPQFEGHYQPHLPDELGYYNLLDSTTQRKQIELAKLHGVGGFCFYTYWFAGKLLLEKPIENYLKDQSLDLPFCLCWANENWSRRWDGLDSDILIDQKHSPEDDLAFIQHISQYMKDDRYIRIDGKPLLLVYRPSLFPSAKETSKRWREWCLKNGIGEIYLAYTQSFETVDPSEYSFDAAIEFPPNNSSPPNITDTVKPSHAHFCSTIYDWRIFVERSRNYQKPAYQLFRSVCPSWDNTARRKNAGTVFLHSTPEDYQEWLTNAVDETCTRIDNLDERLIFVNAWNEWAEGAHLEPDMQYGYAYLQATRNALEKINNESEMRRIVLVAHDAYPHGAQYLILNMAKVLSESMGFIVDMIVLGEGQLIEEYRKYANVHELAGYDPQGKEAIKLIQQLHKQGASSAIANTTVTGLIVPVLKKCGFKVVSLIHELPQLIEDYGLHEHVNAIARDADKIVFAATAVRKGFESFVKLDKEKVVIRPQGIYKKNALQTAEQIESAHSELRKRFNLPDEAIIVLGVGFADYRKGIDIFVASGIEVLKKNDNIYFLWLGSFEPEIEKKIKQNIKKSGLDNHFIFPGLDYESDIYYAGADIYALTSREYPFPSVVMEALDALTPVIAFTKSGGSAELLSKEGGVLVNKMTSKAFASALIKLINNPEKLNQLGHEGKKIVDDEFSFRKYLFDLATLAQTDLKRISVVVPNYNYDQYIEERLQTIIDQSYPIYEVIILDDSSTDNSVNVINEFIKNQVIDCKFIVNADNSGNVFKQWTKGVDLSAGDYVWIAEADDLAEADFLEEIIRPLTDDKAIVLSYCQSMQVSESGKILCPDYLDYVSDISPNKWLNNYTNKGIDEIKTTLAIKNTIPNVSAVVFDRNVLLNVLKENIAEIKKYRVAGDWLTYLLVLRAGEISFSPKSLNLHRRHSESITLSSFNDAQLKEILSVQKRVRDDFHLDDEIVQKAQVYSQYLFEEFGLATDEVPELSLSPELKVYLDNAQ